MNIQKLWVAKDGVAYVDLQGDRVFALAYAAMWPLQSECENYIRNKTHDAAFKAVPVTIVLYEGHGPIPEEKP